MGDSLRVQDIIKKLKLLDCPLFTNGDDAWIREILFKQNCDRYDLIEWIFKKMEFYIPKGDECQNSLEMKLKNLLTAVSGLGLCTDDNSDLIEGIAPFKEQLNFWSLLVDILWRKCYSSHHRVESIEEQYEKHSKYINDLCNSVNFKHLFKEKVQLFPAHIKKENEAICAQASSKTKGLKEIKEIALKSNDNVNPNWTVKNDILEANVGFSQCCDSLLPHNELCDVEDNLCNSLINLSNHVSGDFKNTYNKLKLYLNNPQDETIDVGPAFEATQMKSDTFLKLKDSLQKLKSSKIEMKGLNSKLESLQMPSEPLPDVLLGEYIATLNEEKELQKA
ncbi:uncharacterized protein LOC129969575 [Argiope bruennichi]|uniref:HAUS augmin-like complex subunit 7 like protein n=1 Tax=Argiope bruennichi TaxID=94029 RepID=A0A8T0FNF1_ARGBR|nr:uncharacterized protein LOC129969575 [Argiope bruennichi]KAF8792714.1 HAUS augmin-like complex subunit 7 like protein [Argiope bruennichi]